MKSYLLNYLVCPSDGGKLELEVFKEQTVQMSSQYNDEISKKRLAPDDFKVEIIDGILINEREKKIFPVYKGIPRLLLFHHPLLETFYSQYRDRIEKFNSIGYQFPADSLIPGETNVLQSFSAEWTDYGYTEEAYWGQTAEVYNNSLFSTLDNESQPLKDGVVLEVGIGSGGSANNMSKRFDCNLIGVDLGYSVDVAYQNFSSNPFLHVVQASAFNLPFRDQSFDFVYSHGVIHHTFDTHRAFKQLSRLPKKGGRMYVWVYSFLNESRTTKRKIIMTLERMIRPWCSELPGWMQTIVLQPIVPLYIFHQNAVYQGRNGMAKYSWREALHAARDRFTPKYIHRHSEEEVMGWFQENGFERVRPLSEKNLPEYVPEGFFMNTGVEGFKK